MRLSTTLRVSRKHMALSVQHYSKRRKLNMTRHSGNVRNDRLYYKTVDLDIRLFSAICVSHEAVVFAFRFRPHLSHAFCAFLRFLCDFLNVLHNRIFSPRRTDTRISSQPHSLRVTEICNGHCGAFVCTCHCRYKNHSKRRKHKMIRHSSDVQNDRLNSQTVELDIQ